MTCQYVEIEGLGKVFVKRNKRAKRMIFRVQENNLIATVPYYATKNAIVEAIQANTTSLSRLLKGSKSTSDKIRYGFTIDAELFKLKVIQGNKLQTFVNKEGDVYVLALASNLLLDQANVQSWLTGAIEQVMRKQAGLILPAIVYDLADKWKLKVREVKINLSKGRWGSCSSKGNINLSAFMLLLPRHLIEAVILHELAHLTEMNHSSKFWSLLDKYSNGNAEKWNLELKKYRTSIT